MRTSSELLLTFLLNAVWQIALLAALASFGAWLLRQSATRYQHWIWVAALSLSVLVPVVTAVRSLPETVSPLNNVGSVRELEDPVSVHPYSFERTAAIASNSAFPLDGSLAVVLLSVFAGFVLYRSFKLGQAWLSTRRVRAAAIPLEETEALAI